MQVILVINCTFRKVQKPQCNHIVQIVLFKKGQHMLVQCIKGLYSVIYDIDHGVLMLELFNSMCYSAAGVNATILLTVHLQTPIRGGI
jgi:hypothetical protein